MAGRKSRKWNTLFLYEWNQGVRNRIPFFLLSVLLFFLACVSAEKELLPFVVSDGKVAMSANVSDYLLAIYKGVPVPIPGETFRIPVLWICLFLVPVALHIPYLWRDWMERAKIMIPAWQTRRVWWNGKCVWCVMTCGITQILFLGTVFLYATAKGGRGIVPHETVWNSVIDTSATPQKGLFAIMVLILPFFLLLCFMMLSQLLTVLISPLLGVSVCIVFLVLSVYKRNGWILGNYGMICRLEQASPGGVSAWGGIIICAAIVLCAVIIGNVTIKRKQILS